MRAGTPSRHRSHSPPDRLSSTGTVFGFSLGRPARSPLVWGALLVVAGGAWAFTFRTAGLMGSGPGTLGMDLAAFMPMSAAMMAAMMLPAVAPVGSLYLRGVALERIASVRALRTAGLLVGYLGVWVAFGLVAYAIAWAAGLLAARYPAAAPWVAAAVLGAAGIYQLTPLKDLCLRQCRSPLGLLIRYSGFAGRLRDVRVGAAHGSFCLGCCWGLMVVLIVVGVMNLGWMAALAALVFVEKTWRYGRWVGVAAGVALIALAVLVPGHPQLAPGFYAPPTATPM